MSERYGSPASVLQTVPESNPLSRTLPAGSALDAEVFMGMGASDNGESPQHRPDYTPLNVECILYIT